MQWQQLVYFKTVADIGSMNKAADALMMTQPNLSRSIRNLEKELNLSVFTRDNRGVRLTEDGRKLYRYASNVIEQMDLIENIAERQSHRVLSVIAFPCVIPYGCLEKLYEDCREEHIRCDLRTGRITEIAEAVSSLKAEVGVLPVNEFQRQEVRSLLDSRQLEFHPLYTDTWYAYIGPKNPLYTQPEVDIHDLLQYTCLRAADDRFSILTSYMKIDGVRIGSGTGLPMHTDEEAFLLKILQETDAFTFGYKIKEEDFLERGIVCKAIKGNQIQVEMGWVKRKREVLSSEAMRFLKHFTSFAETRAGAAISQMI